MASSRLLGSEKKIKEPNYGRYIFTANVLMRKEVGIKLPIVTIRCHPLT